MKPVIVFSHGFGVRFDDRGLLTDIAQGFMDYESVLFDYSQVDDDKNILTATPLTQQAEMLGQIVEKSRKPGQELILVCHSQGCIAGALAKIKGIKKAIFLAPPPDSGQQNIEKLFDGRSGARLNKQGMSVLPRRDGTTTHIPKDYWDSLKTLDVTHLYQELASSAELTIVRATEDEVLGNTDFGWLQNVEVRDVVANHDFTGKARKELLALLHHILG